MRGRRREVIATVDCDPERAPDDAFDVSHDRRVTLTIPDALPPHAYSSSRRPFVRSYAPDVARALGEALIRAADEVKGADDA